MSVVHKAGEHLFAFFRTVVPLPAVAPAGKRSSPALKKLASGLDQFYAEARTQRTQMRLGVIRRAQVAFYLQQRLLAAGYPADLVRQVLFAMLMSAFVGRGFADR